MSIPIQQSTFKWEVKLYNNGSSGKPMFTEIISDKAFKNIKYDCKFCAEENMRLIPEHGSYNFNIYPVFEKNNESSGKIKKIQVVLISNNTEVFSKYYPLSIFRTLAYRLYLREKDNYEELVQNSGTEKTFNFHVACTPLSIEESASIEENPIDEECEDIGIIFEDNGLELGAINSYPDSDASKINILKTIGSPQATGRKIFIKKEAWESIIELSKSIENEHGGLLVGRVFREKNSKKFMTKIEKAIKFENFQSSKYSLSVTPDGLASIRKNFEEGQNCGGMFHFHPLFSEKCKSCTTASLDPEKCVINPQMSITDIFNYEDNFFENYNVGLILVPFKKMPKTAMYCWKDGEISQTNGFYIYKE